MSARIFCSVRINHPQLKGELYEARNLLSAAIGISQEFQAETRPPDQTVAETHAGVSAGEPVWGQTTPYHRPLAQEQSARPITGRPRSVTVGDDHFPRVAEAD